MIPASPPPIGIMDLAPIDSLLARRLELVETGRQPDHRDGIVAIVGRGRGQLRYHHEIAAVAHLMHGDIRGTVKLELAVIRHYSCTKRTVAPHVLVPPQTLPLPIVGEGNHRSCHCARRVLITDSRSGPVASARPLR